MEQYYGAGKQVFGGTWTLRELIGRGSYGSVYEAVRTGKDDGQKAAIKVIPFPNSDDDIREKMANNFTADAIRKEYETSADRIEDLLNRLKGKAHIVRYEAWERVPHKDGIGFDLIVRMEKLTPLLEYIQTHTFDQREAARLGCHICAALEVCKAERIIHRDVKPGNILVTDGGEYKLGDFGVAMISQGSVSIGYHTKAGAPDYMAPEVQLCKKYNSTVDIYSLGLVLYYRISRKDSPTVRGTDTINWKKSLPPQTHIDPDLDMIIRTACSYSPRKRYPAAALMKEDLRCYLMNAPVFWWKPDRWKLTHPAVLIRQVRYYMSHGMFPVDFISEYGTAPEDITDPPDSGGETVFIQHTEAPNEKTVRLFSQESGQNHSAVNIPAGISPALPRPGFPLRHWKTAAVIAALLLVTLCASVFTGLSKDNAQQPRENQDAPPETEMLSAPVVDSVTLDEDAYTLKAGESVSLSAVVMPEDTEETLVWSSTDETVAVVRDDGTVTALKAGETTVTASCGNVSAACLVTVQEEPKIVWSDWTETLPEDIDSESDEVQEKIQYSSRTRQLHESSSSALDGWTLIDQSDAYGEYGSWSDWTENAVNSSDTTQVESKNQYRSRTRETTTSSSSSLDGWTLVDSTASYGDYGSWSDWTTSNPGKSDTTQVETKTQYRSRTRETTTSSSSSLDGWTRTGSSSSYGDYGSWSDWTTTAASANDTTRVDTKTQYRYRDKQTTTSEKSSLDGWKCTGGPNFGDWGNTQTSSSRPSESDTLRITDTRQVQWGYYHYCNQYPNGGNGWNIDSIAYGSSSTYHSCTTGFALPGFSMSDHGGQQAYGGMGTGAPACPWNFYVWFRDSGRDAYEYSYQTRSVSYTFERWGDWSGWSDSSVSGSGTRDVETRTLYRTSTRTQKTTYTFERWGSWSSWSDTAVSASDTRDVDTRTLYRSRTRSLNRTYSFERWGSWSDWSDTAVSSSSSRRVEQRTLYRSRTRSKTTTYLYEQWGDWSEYSDVPVSESEDVKVRTKTLYRYQIWTVKSS